MREEGDIAFDGPAVAANRVAFMEVGPNTASRFRTAVLLTRGDAVALRDLLASIVEPAQGRA